MKKQPRALNSVSSIPQRSIVSVVVGHLNKLLRLGAYSTSPKGNNMRIKVAVMTNRQLNWAVAICEGGKVETWHSRAIAVLWPGAPRAVPWDACTHWAQGGPIIEREGIQLHVNEEHTEWLGSCWGYSSHQYAPTPLIAAMRCRVASKLGDEIDVPNELI